MILIIIKIMLKIVIKWESVFSHVKSVDSSSYMLMLTETELSFALVLAQHGKLKQIRLVANREGKFKGYGYVEYEEEVRRKIHRSTLQCV